MDPATEPKSMHEATIGNASGSLPHKQELTSGEPLTSSSHKSRQRTRLGVMVRGLALPALVLIAWQIVCQQGMVTQTILPSPMNILTAFRSLAADGLLGPDVWISLMRVGIGFALGGGVGLLLGIITGFSRTLEELVDPTVQMLRTIPHLSVIPLFIMWFGLGEWSKILLIATGAFFPLYINTFMGIRGVDKKLFEVSQILAFSRFRQLTILIIPAALPSILVGARLSIGVSWLGVVVAELVGSSSGVGYMIEQASQFSQTANIFVGIVIFAVMGKVTDSLVRWLEKRLLRWRDSFSG